MIRDLDSKQFAKTPSGLLVPPSEVTNKPAPLSYVGQGLEIDGHLFKVRKITSRNGRVRDIVLSYLGIRVTNEKVST